MKCGRNSWVFGGVACGDEGEGGVGEEREIGAKKGKKFFGPGFVF